MEDDSTWNCNKLYLMLSMQKTQFRKIQFVQDKNTWKYPAQNENEKKICGYFYLEQIVFFSDLLCGPKSNHEGRPEYIPKRLQKNDLSYISGARVCFLILGVWTRGTFSKRRFFFLQWDKIAVMMHAPCMHVGADSLKNIDYWFFFVFQPGANH